MNLHDHNIFTFIKQHVSILTVVSEYATLKRAGLYWKGHCPFHHEKTASFTVSPHKEIFYCFGCHEGGDVIAFIEKVEHCSAVQAAHHLAERYSISLPETISHKAPINTDELARYHQLCSFIAHWSHEQLLKHPPALEYLTARGTVRSTIDGFMLGYFPGGLAAVKQLITQAGQNHILVDDLLNAHILARGKTVLFSSFEERILFPITDALGRIVGFGGRIFRPNDTRPKYYNSHDSAYFNKGSLLFGLHLAKKAIQAQQQVIVVEGYMDCLAMVQQGFVQTVATLGTACNEEHLKLLNRYAPTLYVLYDADKAGHQAILRMATLAWHASMDLYVVPLPASEDPASFIQKGGTISQCIEQSQPIFEFFIHSLGAAFKDQPLSEKVQAVRTLVDTISKVSDPLKQDILLAQAAQSLAIPYDSLKRELQRAKPGYKPQKTAVRPTGPQELEHIPALEKKVFFAIMNNIQLCTKEHAAFLRCYLPEPLRGIITRLYGALTDNLELTFTLFYDQLSETERHQVSNIVLSQDSNAPGPTFDQLIEQLQRKYWKLIVNDIKMKLHNATQEQRTDDVNQLLNQLATLKQQLVLKDSAR